MLETKEFQVEHTGIQIASELQDILQCWDLPEDKIVAATTDNGTNIVCALEQLGGIILDALRALSSWQSLKLLICLMYPRHWCDVETW